MSSCFSPALAEAVEPARLLTPDGELLGEAPLSDEQALEALRWMLLSRALDERMIALQRSGRIGGSYVPVHGQEASVIGSALALDAARDWIVPAYRENPALLRHGLPLDRLLAQYLGRLDAARIPDNVLALPRNQAVAAQLTHAAGLAWGLRLRGEGAVAMVYFGEGASSEGEFHESANLAGVMRAPLVYLLQNNRWAISTPSTRQSAARWLAARAIGYGFPGEVVDGNDLFAVYRASGAAVARARAGQGPTLIEAITYRMGFHNTTDNPREYRTREEEEAEREADPIRRLTAYLEKKKVWSPELAERTAHELEAEIDSALGAAAEYPRPAPSAVREHVFGEAVR